MAISRAQQTKAFFEKKYNDLREAVKSIDPRKPKCGQQHIQQNMGKAIVTAAVKTATETVFKK